MYLETFLADFAVFRVFLGISQDFAEIPEFCGSATVRNIRSPVELLNLLVCQASTSFVSRQLSTCSLSLDKFILKLGDSVVCCAFGICK